MLGSLFYIVSIGWQLFVVIVLGQQPLIVVDLQPIIFEAVVQDASSTSQLRSNRRFGDTGSNLDINKIL